MSELKSREQMAEEHLHGHCPHDDEEYRRDCQLCVIDLLCRRDEMVIDLVAKEICLGCANDEPLVDRYLEKYWHMETGTCRAKAIRALKERLR